ncbi:hypothetical protein AMTR_s00101p00115890 [Amborella trichopoda]|uniref:Uncharacterized protein n=1 Tax=Amborella trichopoda TaxID=13333 RepID=W1NU34_AMBTC|nr:hypothetical protein AMTR_s00101p00115890 [Amborella trichopoda]
MVTLTGMRSLGLKICRSLELHSSVQNLAFPLDNLSHPLVDLGNGSPKSIACHHHGPYKSLCCPTCSSHSHRTYSDTFSILIDDDCDLQVVGLMLKTGATPPPIKFSRYFLDTD